MSTGRNTTDLLLPLVSCTSSPTSMPRRGTQATNPSPLCASEREGGREKILPGATCCCCCISDGVGRTGSFLVIHAMMERVKTENILDFFQFVKSSRIHRPNVILELVRKGGRGMRWGGLGAEWRGQEEMG